MSRPLNGLCHPAIRSCVLASLVFSVGACSCSSEPQPETPSVPDDFGEPAAPPPAEDEAPPPDPGPAPRVQVMTEVTPDGQVKLRLQQRHDEPVELATQLTVERKHDSGEWRREVGVGALSLRATCEGEVPTCLTLVPGAELSPPPWLGTRGDAQCACEECTPTDPGTYRVVVRTCGDTHQIPSAPFVIPD